MAVYKGLKPICNVCKQEYAAQKRVYPVVILTRMANINYVIIANNGHLGSTILIFWISQILQKSIKADRKEMEPYRKTLK